MVSQLITAGTEQFNKSPSTGVLFLQEQGLLQNPMNPVEVATFLRQNPALSKQLLGDFLGARSHAAVLEAFVRCVGVVLSTAVTCGSITAGASSSVV